MPFVERLGICYNSTILRKEGVRMGFTEETVRFKILDDSNKKEISETLTDVYASLNDKATTQLTKS